MNELVVLTKKFGNNFTGATITTQFLCNNWCDIFSKVTVLTLETGVYERKKNLEVKKVDNIFNLIKEIDIYKRQNCTFYSDDHLGFLLGLKKINYLHTYHGNWPDARWINLNFFLKSFFFIPAYTLTLRKAARVVNVSYYMDKFVRRYNGNTVVIRNGINQKTQKNSAKIGLKKKIIMIGNIDKRKYGTCLKLFKRLEAFDLNIKIDIYGSVVDVSLAKQLSAFKFVNIVGFVNNIEINKYDVMLTTSTTENLPISIVEAIKAHIPVFSYNVGGVNEIIVSGVNGFLVENKNVIELSNIIKLYYMHGWDFEFELVDNKLEEFDWESSYKMYLKQFLIISEGEK